MTSNTFSGTTILVTGAAGFIGASLMTRLASTGARLVGLVRQGTCLGRLQSLPGGHSLLYADLQDFDAVSALVEETRPDYVFHTATCRDESDWKKALAVNCTAPVNVLQAAASPGLRAFIHCGSAMEYGTGSSPLKECVSCQPDTVYGASKAAGTLLLQQRARAHGLPVVILRPFYVYGPGESRRRFIPVALQALLQQKDIDLTSPGIQHDLVFIDDVVDACIRAASHRCPPGQVINIASGCGTTNEEVIACLARLTGRQARVNTGAFAKRPWDRTSLHADISLAMTLLGWAPQHDLQAGLQKSLEWHLANP